MDLEQLPSLVTLFIFDNIAWLLLGYIDWLHLKDCRSTGCEFHLWFHSNGLHCNGCNSQWGVQSEDCDQQSSFLMMITVVVLVMIMIIIIMTMIMIINIIIVLITITLSSTVGYTIPVA